MVWDGGGICCGYKISSFVQKFDEVSHFLEGELYLLAIGVFEGREVDGDAVPEVVFPGAAFFDTSMERLADAEISVDVPPDYVAPDTEKLELQRLRSDIEKFLRSRLFLEQHKEDWASLLDPENTRWHLPERTVTWPLKEIIANKERVKERQKQLEAAGSSVGFLGQKPEGVPEDVDDMVRTQVAPVQEVYSGAYRRQTAVVTEVDNFEGVLPGCIVAVNLEGNYKPPHLAKVKEVTNSSFTMEWLKESWLRSSIHDNVVALEGFNIIRRDRVESEHGGVCIPVQDINKHLRPISLTPILSKIAEEYVVDTYVKPAVLSKIDPQQFGTVPKSSATHALISMIHSWAKSTDGNGSTTRVVLFDFRKAFDLIDHHVLARKLSSYDIPRPILCWIMDFLTNRKQRIKLSRDCFSEWEAVPAGVPQGTKLGPWLFLIMINNLSVADTIIWKYVDDTTLVESVLKNESSYMQLRVNELVRQSEVDGFQFNESKCKELRISFSRSGSLFDHITINDKQIEVVSSARLLGVIVSDNLRWNAHVESICKKAAKRLYFLKQLKRAKVPSEDMLLFYTTCIRPVLEYACPVFHHSLPQYLSNEMERLQKRALRMIQPDLSYAEVLVAPDIASLYERREILCDALFDQIVRDENHKLHDLLPPRNKSTYRTRSQRYFKLPICKTNRFKNTFIMANSFNY
ncbi:RNA-directed DNA polymerase from mobile element jockey [Stylophora pistillata]|uniref:RNA-directed DNA polymerase from mobile element jockey n=1 Tax=Stylophora pistillata TaxID=50429 RepID=A0A2B4SDM8_STYPI|nr:RNA-directed DNA polymerase from mobile element jockey [Stylophora pistillata]